MELQTVGSEGKKGVGIGGKKRRDDIRREGREMSGISKMTFK